jgi:hypothetical protein
MPDACCQQHSYYTKITPARLGKDSRKDRESGYDIDFYRDLTVTGATIGYQWEPEIRESGQDKAVLERLETPKKPRRHLCTAEVRDSIPLGSTS